MGYTGDTSTHMSEFISFSSYLNHTINQTRNSTVGKESYQLDPQSLRLSNPGRCFLAQSKIYDTTLAVVQWLEVPH